jgi:type IV pilus assembly protein PilB
MKKVDLDSLINQLDDLGQEVAKAAAADASKAAAAPKPAVAAGVAAADGTNTPAAPPARKGHNLDDAPAVPLPTVPVGQRAFGKAIVPKHDPSVPLPPPVIQKATVGQSLTDIYKPEGADGPAAAIDLGAELVARGAVTSAQFTNAQNVIKQTPGRRLADVLLETGGDEQKIQQCIADLAGLSFENIDLNKGLDGGFDGTLVQRLGIDFCKASAVVPLRTEGSRVVIGLTRPDDVFLVDEVRRRLGVTSVKAVVVTAYDARGALEIVSGAGGGDTTDVNKLIAEVSETDVQVDKGKNEEVDLEKEAGESPIIKIVNRIIQTAVKEGASDIHIEPTEKKLRVRLRIDGELFDSFQPPASMGAAVTSRLKIMANLDISERRVPQDGRIRCSVGGRKLDLRVSTLPNGYGEKTVMRILDTKSINVKLEDLGFDDDTLRIWKGLVDAPHGVVLVTGPTGSGKTTTLYASLKQLDKNSMNICTVEDPVEYHLDGLTQCQTHDKIGMTFAKALKSLLRQDPDVIMVGEIRDHETAITAIQAALTGHLVLSTLHTNDAPSSITRLVNIGIEPFLVAAGLNGVLAQRLLRKLCAQCKRELEPNEEMQEFLQHQGMSADKLWSGKGCDRCRNTGYSGRVGIYELLSVDDSLRDVVARNPNVAELRRLCMERGMVTLRTDGLRKAARGLTSVEEVLRVTESTI